MNFQDLYNNDNFANNAGIILDEICDSHATLHVTVEHNHLNGGNMAHGALIFLLADVTMAALANQRQPVSVSIQSDIRFLTAAAQGDTLTATATEVFARKRMFNARVEIKNQTGALIAVAEGMFHTKQI